MGGAIPLLPLYAYAFTLSEENLDGKKVTLNK
jgi:hypothetical protein